MSIDTIHHVVISDTPSFKSNTLFMDILRPQTAKRCFICVSKFNASYALNPIGVLLTYPPAEQFEIQCDAILNSYRYDAASKSVIRSNILDTYVSTTLNTFTILGVQEQVVSFNIINNIDNWQEIDINRLSNLTFNFFNNFKIATAFSYNLHLKIKFSE